MINPDDLDRSKLTILSLGSICGMSLGVLGGYMLPNIYAAVIISGVLLGFGGYTIFKNIYLLLN